MQPLDEDLLNKITYLPECQATFRKYKENLMREFLKEIAIIISIFAACILIRYFILDEIPNHPLLFLGVAFFAVIGSFSNFVSIYKLRKDMASQKLDIKTDIFIKPIVQQTDDGSGTKYLGLFQETGEMDVPGAIIGRFTKNSKVYIVRTVYSKTLLDIIPADKIDHQT